MLKHVIQVNLKTITSANMDNLKKGIVIPSKEYFKREYNRI